MDNSVILAVISVLLTVIGGISAWNMFVLSGMRNDVDKLQRADIELGREMSAVKVLVAGQYVTRDEFRSVMREQTGQLIEALKEVRNEVATVKQSVDRRSASG